MPKRDHRTSSLANIKFLIATSSFAGILALWALFANQERRSQLQSSLDQFPVQDQPASQWHEPLPTLLSIQLPDGQAIELVQPSIELRAVSAPPASRPNSNPVVISNSGAGQDANNAGSTRSTITTTSSSG